ncbi:unnamed protein product [Schistosoma rodhaini]|uniref:Uncharacterized protein n=1 Tax=Schistosoma rodhaini TaxID=6188 RepID=A0AA85FRM1_9TREM|nr:unnamed protein product [Schistosoma rodhaini]
MYCHSFTLLKKDYISDVTKQSKHRLYNIMKLSGANCLVVFSLLQLLVAFSHCDINAITCNKTVCCASEDGKKGPLCCGKDGCPVPSTPDLLLGNYLRHRQMKNYLEEVCKYFIYTP